MQRWPVVHSGSYLLDASKMGSIRAAYSSHALPCLLKTTRFKVYGPRVDQQPPTWSSTLSLGGLNPVQMDHHATTMRHL